MGSQQIPFSHSDLGADKGKSNTTRGKQPLIIGHTVGGGERSANRKYLAKAFGNMHIAGLKSSPALYNKNVLGPFRSAFNAGDVITNGIYETDIKYGRESNQVGGNNLSKLNVSRDGISGQKGKAMFSGNPKKVYDGSDYARFKKLNAINKNFNDLTYGNDSTHRQSQHAIRRVRK